LQYEANKVTRLGLQPEIEAALAYIPLMSVIVLLFVSFSSLPRI
jgi:hypothetical protein